MDLLLRQKLQLAIPQDWKARMRMLSEKWSTVQNTLEKEKYEKKIFLDDKLKNIENKINKERPQEELKFKDLKEQMLRLQDDIVAERHAREVIFKIKLKIFDEKNEKNLQSCEENLNNLLEEEKSTKKSNEERIFFQSNERFQNLDLALNKNSKIYEDTKDKKLNEIQTQINLIKEQVFSEARKREESTNNLMEEIEGEIANYHESLLIEKKNEKKERHSTTESLLALLEDTCNKIDKNLKL